MPETKKSMFRTSHWAQCRNEAPFHAIIKIIAGEACIDCPHCARRYVPRPRSDDWWADRTLVFLTPEEAAEAEKKSV